VDRSHGRLNHADQPGVDECGRPSRRYPGDSFLFMISVNLRWYTGTLEPAAVSQRGMGWVQVCRQLACTQF
jgi:hypothetical protein